MRFVVPVPPLGVRVRMFLHSRRCEECRIQFWAATAVEFSDKALTESLKGFDTRRVSMRARIYLQIAKFATRRRLQAQRAAGQIAYEDMTPEQQAHARAEIDGMMEQARKAVMEQIGQGPRMH